MTLEITVPPDGLLTEWRGFVTASAAGRLHSFVLPSLNGFGQISNDPNRNELAYPSLSGLLVTDPLHTFRVDRGIGWELYYPSGFSNMQFVAYYSRERATGLFMSAQDSSGSIKFFNVGVQPTPGCQFAPRTCLHGRKVASGKFRTRRSLVCFMAIGTTLLRSIEPGRFSSRGRRAVHLAVARICRHGCAAPPHGTSVVKPREAFRAFASKPRAARLLMAACLNRLGGESRPSAVLGNESPRQVFMIDAAREACY